jgi:hypothetical protein
LYKWSQLINVSWRKKTQLALEVIETAHDAEERGSGGSAAASGTNSDGGGGAGTPTAHGAAATTPTSGAGRRERESSSSIGSRGGGGSGDGEEQAAILLLFITEHATVAEQMLQMVLFQHVHSVKMQRSVTHSLGFVSPACTNLAPLLYAAVSNDGCRQIALTQTRRHRLIVSRFTSA